jgi:hypothetical protein
MGYPHAIVNLGNKTYACPGWFEVPSNTVCKDLLKMDFGVEKEEIIEIKESPKIERLVTSSDGKNQYTVKFNGLHWNCTCVGFGFRRYCKHIEEVKLELKNKKS